MVSPLALPRPRRATRSSQIFFTTAARFRHPRTVRKSRVAYASQTPRGVRDFPQSDKKIASRAYSENRPFLDGGKDQKSLNRQNAPLTIEQVRELLNKNK